VFFGDCWGEVVYFGLRVREMDWFVHSCQCIDCWMFGIGSHFVFFEVFF